MTLDTPIEEHAPQERTEEKKTWHQPSITEIDSIQHRTQGGLIGDFESPPVYRTS